MSTPLQTYTNFLFGKRNIVMNFNFLILPLHLWPAVATSIIWSSQTVFCSQVEIWKNISFCDYCVTNNMPRQNEPWLVVRTSLGCKTLSEILWPSKYPFLLLPLFWNWLMAGFSLQTGGQFPKERLETLYGQYL